jgi:hypothetical protein
LGTIIRPDDGCEQGIFGLYGRNRPASDRFSAPAVISLLSQLPGGQSYRPVVEEVPMTRRIPTPLRPAALGSILVAALFLSGQSSRADILFNNYPGDAGSHGFVGAFTPTVLAGEFQMGSQAYTLDSATVYPINTSFSGSLTSNALLYLYSNDTTKNQPLANTGVTMSLTAGESNPVTLSAGQGFVPLTFMPTTPVTLQPNTGYWLALSFDNPTAFNLGEAADNTLATGVAAIRAASRSFDDGVTWNAADTGSSWPMTISGTLTGVPEPGSLTLLGLAAIGWVRYWRRRWQAGARLAPTVFDRSSQTGAST